jgi:regulation of enolase protein 1 (concanavalin A-like superfamily)
VNWINEPSQWSSADGQILVRSDPQTDFWRVTGYGYVRDNAHIFGEALTSDFDLSVQVRADYAMQYDQAGAAVRIDESHWIKTGVEHFNGRNRFSTVVTSEYSSWMMGALPDEFTTLNLSLARRGDALEIRYSTDQREQELAAVVYVEPGASAFAGVMCAAPEGDGFAVTFSGFDLRAR